LDAATKSELIEKVHNGEELKIFYELELATALGAPAWLEVLLEGKPVLLPTRSRIAWSWLYSELAKTQTPILVSASPSETARMHAPLGHWASDHPWMLTVKVVDGP
jgi:hypothetical protein